MKKVLFSAVLVSAFGTAAFAADYGSAGCGLGSLAFRQNDMTQVLAATTNGTFGSQTFGITFGTSGCNNKGLVKMSMARESFIEANYKDLSRDAAAGKGEYVANLARLYGFTPENTGSFASLLQKNHTAIFAANSAKTAVNEINRLIGSL
ncbi:MAG: hypothetical protein A2X28_10220 [Elusimicrobia bacterium GWA2_56_46]|nr:MAG: hypothetical protein A2X28_10220 [Elusimicrobia bacterium GWA2_56_46]OGR55958.1 MAG: hypothetical protein A2X39_05170 [Elusimicrobia bacterium GWC2_56_31]HBB68231.1 hypothetical protein [Elusimicrobiota bacterium]HBW22827.1 hypothetical protein [Elusimicrobiota bacterium]